jgi:hypothetical protein
MWLHQDALAFEDTDRGTLKESYFSPYIIPTVPHIPWEYKNIPIPPGIQDKVIEVLKLKIDAGVYEASQSAYRSRWFCVIKKNGKLRIVHDLQPLNKVTIRDAGLPPILDDFVEPDSQACLDAHLSEKKPKDHLVPYSDALFHDAAIEWLIQTDQVCFASCYMTSCLFVQSSLLTH